MLNKITFISVQPDELYFHWQVEVMINNFILNRINPSYIQVIFSYDDIVSSNGKELSIRYPEVKFFFYKRSVINNHGYNPILRPDTLEQHFKKYPELKDEVIFYHDCDIIFRELPNFEDICDDDIWYLSDTISYIGSKYIKSKSDQLFLDLCNIVNIDPKIVEMNEMSSGGAQYLMKRVDSQFWKVVKEDAMNLYVHMRDIEFSERKLLSQEEVILYNPIQKWCADMWAVLWGAWKRGITTKISDEMEFSWATSDIESYHKCKIFHNAGVVSSTNGLFCKSDFINSDPFDSDFSDINPDMASSKYVEAILYTKNQKLKQDLNFLY